MTQLSCSVLHTSAARLASRPARPGHRGWRWLPLALGLAALSTTSAAAQTGASSAFGESLNLQILPLLGSPVQVASGPLPAVASAAPPAYDLSDDIASLQVTSPPLGTVLQTGLIQAEAASQLPGAPQVLADATLAALKLQIAPDVPVLKLTADAVSSRALISCPCGHGPAQAGGSANLANAHLSVLPGINFTVDAHPAPNTVLVDVPGLRVVLNEQILHTNASGDIASLTVNAVHVHVDVLPVPGAGLVTGDIILSQSQAQMACVDLE